MTAASPRSFAHSLPTHETPSQGSAELSFGNSFDKSSGFDPRVFGARFPDRWQAFLRRFHSSPLEVAVVYGVTEKAAEKWWNGIGGPRGGATVIAFRVDPQGFQDYLAADL